MNLSERLAANLFYRGKDQSGMMLSEARHTLYKVKVLSKKRSLAQEKLSSAL